MSRRSAAGRRRLMNGRFHPKSIPMLPNDRRPLPRSRAFRSCKCAKRRSTACADRALSAPVFPRYVATADQYPSTTNIAFVPATGETHVQLRAKGEPTLLAYFDNVTLPEARIAKRSGPALRGSYLIRRRSGLPPHDSATKAWPLLTPCLERDRMG